MFASLNKERKISTDQRGRHLSSKLHYLSSGWFDLEVYRDWHMHHGVELLYVAKGICRRDYRDSRLSSAEYRAGTVVVTPPGMVHALYVGRGSVACHLSMDVIGSGIDTSARTIDIGTDRLLDRWFYDAAQFFGTLETETVSHLGEAIWSRLATLESRSNFRRSVHPAVWQAIDIFSASYNREFNISEIAGRVGVSPNHLNALFRRIFNFGPSQYLQRLRVAHAREMLAEPWLSIAEVAERCGFRDQNYLSRKFREHYGESPTEYRKRRPDRPGGAPPLIPQR